MSSTEVSVDVEVLRGEIRKTYTDVSIDREREFIFPTGRAWAQELGYPEPELSRVPDATVERFAGVANHWTVGRIEPGQVVLDLGCGAGTDVLIAAQMTGPTGRVIGVDMTPAMLEQARASAVQMGLQNVELHESLIESLPIEHTSVDVVISNGVIDLVPDKEAVFDEIDRVLRPGGRLQVRRDGFHDSGEQAPLKRPPRGLRRPDEGAVQATFGSDEGESLGGLLSQGPPTPARPTSSSTPKASPG
jgi:arsenite methyltransferase